MPLAQRSRVPSGVDAARRKSVAEAVRTLHGIFQTVDAFSKRALRLYGVTGPQLWALRVIDAAGDLAAGELAEAMHLHASTITGVVDRLERRRLVTRTRGTGDRRVVSLRITPAGRVVLRRAPEPPRSRIARGLERLPGRELACIRRSLDRVARLMRAGTVTPRAGRRRR